MPENMPVNMKPFPRFVMVPVVNHLMGLVHGSVRAVRGDYVADYEYMDLGGSPTAQVRYDDAQENGYPYIDPSVEDWERYLLDAERQNITLPEIRFRQIAEEAVNGNEPWNEAWAKVQVQVAAMASLNAFGLPTGVTRTPDQEALDALRKAVSMSWSLQKMSMPSTVASDSGTAVTKIVSILREAGYDPYPENGYPRGMSPARPVGDPSDPTEGPIPAGLADSNDTDLDRALSWIVNIVRQNWENGAQMIESDEQGMLDLLKRHNYDPFPEDDPERDAPEMSAEVRARLEANEAGTLSMTDWWVDGHYIGAPTVQEAYREAARIYNYTPSAMRPWTAEDQANLDKTAQAIADANAEYGRNEVLDKRDEALAEIEYNATHADSHMPPEGFRTALADAGVERADGEGLIGRAPTLLMEQQHGLRRYLWKRAESLIEATGQDVSEVFTSRLDEIMQETLERLEALDKGLDDPHNPHAKA